jgi:hypothetical protein
MSSIAVALNQVARTRAGSGTNNCAFLSADQGTSNRSCDSADDGAFGLTVVMAVRTPMRQALRGGTEKNKHE